MAWPTWAGVCMPHVLVNTETARQQTPFQEIHKNHHVHMPTALQAWRYCACCIAVNSSRKQ